MYVSPTLGYIFKKLGIRLPVVLRHVLCLCGNFPEHYALEIRSASRLAATEVFKLLISHYGIVC